MARKSRQRRRVQRSITLDPDQDRWLIRRAAATSSNVTIVVRQLVMAAMASEQEAATAPRKTNGGEAA